ncbi:helix-turn-helix transcriptional regulator [Escherichia coli]|uniref:helix-turn-helix transcriptional regulator n=1 Tax=Escherichia coli TaxID=562 RepID=UPI0017E89F64|nr:helix-turn-helix transcriptional regulator [Escherichia coli]
MRQRINKIVINKIIEYIDQQTENGNRVDIATLGNYSGYSCRHLQRLFLTETGMRLGEYIRLKRLNFAVLLVYFSSRSFQDIAFNVGYDSQQSFNREFKNVIGRTPGQYRMKPGGNFPLVGWANGEHFSLSEPEIVQIRAGMICGKKISYQGTLNTLQEDTVQTNPVDKVFELCCLERKEIKMIVKWTPLAQNKYHYRFMGVVEFPRGGDDYTFPYNGGSYLKYTFEITQKSYPMRMKSIYLYMLHNDIHPGRTSCICVFGCKDEKISCSMFVPFCEY